MHRSIEGFTNAAMDRLVAYGWSGNVRELENEIERAVALAGSDQHISAEMLSERIRESEASSRAISEGPREWNLGAAVDDLKRSMIRDALQESGSKTRAALRLGIPRQSLQKMMKRLGLSEPRKD